VYWSAQTVDDHHRSRLRLTAQNEAVRALVSAGSGEEATTELLRAVCENLGWTVGQLWRPAPSGHALSVHSAWTAPAAGAEGFVVASRQAHFQRGIGLPGSVLASGDPEWVRDVVDEPGFVRAAAARAAGLHGAFAVPVPIGPDELGVLEFLTLAVMDPDPELLETMRAVGEHLGQFLHRRRIEAELQASEAQFHAFGNTVADATFVIDGSSRIVYANDAVRRIFGYSPSELVGAPLTRLMPERDRDHHLERMRRYVETGERHTRWEGVEVLGLHRDGTEVPLEITYGAFEKDGRQFLTGIARDITERRRADDQLRFQARLLDAVGEAVMATDLNGRISYWNAAAEKLYGWTAEEVLGRDVLEVTPTSMSRDQAQEAMDQLGRGESWMGEFMVRDRDGRDFPVLVSDSPILNADGQMIGVIGTSMDITEQRRREERQRFMAEASRVLASTLDYSTTLNSVATLAVPHLGDWCLVHVRETEADPLVPVARVVPDHALANADVLERLLTGNGHPMQAVLGGDVALTAPGEPGRDTLPEDRLREAGVTALLAVPLRARGIARGVMTFVSTEPGRRYDPADVALAEELGRRAGMAIDNARLYRDAEEGNRAKADFLAVVSHELRTPLNAITGYADLLAGGIVGELSDAQQHHVERIKVGAGHLAHLIDEILAYARVESGRETVSLETADIAQVARDATVVVEPDAREKGLSVETDIPAQGPSLRTDPGKIRQILVNLLANAIKYTESGSVRLTVRPSGSGVEIRISDTGIGIPPDALERIFTPFWQAESPNTRSVGGTGLGLTVSRRLTELLDGTIEVESEVDVGSTFTVTVPDLSPDPQS
jgi:PAS domain S-box-containing protein